LVEHRGGQAWRRWCCCPFWVVLLPAWSWEGQRSELVSSAWCGATISWSSGWPPSALVARWWLEVAAGGVEADDGSGCSLDVKAAAPRWWVWRAVWTSGQRRRDGGRGEEHLGVWCHIRLRAAATTSCKVGLATSPWWIGFYDLGMGELRAKALH
jgi:hypothetical protein